MKLCIGNLKFGESEFGEMKRNTSNWSNFCILLHRMGLSASAGLSCLALSVNISKTVADMAKLLVTNRESYMGFPLTPTSMTLDDLEPL